MSWDHNCNHLRMARIFTRCPACECILNSTQGVRDRRDLAPRPAAVSITFHKSGDTE